MSEMPIPEAHPPKCVSELRPVVEEQLCRWLPSADDVPARLAEAMHYSVFSGGKRIRPILALLSCRMISSDTAPALPAACAVEFIHTYSLIHDDLPCMDDDDVRRGKPTCHVAFGEALAVLAADGLQALAYEVLSRADYPPGPAVKMVRELSSASGPSGMVGGQVMDISQSNRKAAPEELRALHAAKTGALIRASVNVGAIAAGATDEQLQHLDEYGRQFGLAFQITDDILDVVGDPEKTGRYRGSDQQSDRFTYPRLYGVKRSRQKARAAVERGREALRCFGSRSDELVNLLEFVIARDR